LPFANRYLFVLIDNQFVSTEITALNSGKIEICFNSSRKLRQLARHPSNRSTLRVKRFKRKRRVLNGTKNNYSITAENSRSRRHGTMKKPNAYYNLKK